MDVFGYSWDQVQAMQQRKHVPQKARIQEQECSAQDLDLLELHGKADLAELGFYGVLDRINKAGK